MHPQNTAHSGNVAELPLTPQQRLDALHGRVARSNSANMQVATGLNYVWQQIRNLHASIMPNDTLADERLEQLDSLADAVSKLAETLRASAVES